MIVSDCVASRTDATSKASFPQGNETAGIGYVSVTQLNTAPVQPDIDCNCFEYSTDVIVDRRKSLLSPHEACV